VDDGGVPGIAAAVDHGPAAFVGVNAPKRPAFLDHAGDGVTALPADSDRVRDGSPGRPTPAA
jgi:hypothetical protein